MVVVVGGGGGGGRRIRGTGRLEGNPEHQSEDEDLKALSRKMPKPVNTMVMMVMRLLMVVVMMMVTSLTVWMMKTMMVVREAYHDSACDTLLISILLVTTFKTVVGT